MTIQIFPQQAKSEFMKITYSRYKDMVKRLAKLNLPPVPFNLAAYRSRIIGLMGGSYDGAIHCRYCNRRVALSEAAGDHEVPLTRGGSPGLENVNLICEGCNDQKGSLLPEEFMPLLDFLERYIPHGRLDVLKRLGMANKLANKVARQASLIRHLKATGAWQDAKQATKKPKPPDDGDSLLRDEDIPF